MVSKPRYKRFLLWSIVSTLAILAVAIVIVPPMVSLNKLKPKIQTAILEQTGIAATIRGDVHFSLLGRATIVANNVIIPNGKISHVAFSVPLSSIFDIERASLSDQISVYGGKINIENLQAVEFNHTVNLYNTTVRFMDKDYTIVRAELSGGQLSGTIRTNQHKYDIDFNADEFYIRNQNDNLEIYGQLYSDGTARGRMSIDTDDINSWFEFSEPKISHNIQMTANFDWDGAYGFRFSDIIINNIITGNIELSPDGHRNIQLAATDLDYDLSFLLQPTKLLQNATFDLDLYGNITLGTYDFSHLLIRASGTNNQLQITEIVADKTKITGGTIDASGAHNLMIDTTYDNMPATCLFSGTPDKWQCHKFTWGDAYGTINVTNNKFDIEISSPQPMPENNFIIYHTSKLASTGHVKFTFANMGGTLDITKKSVTPHYTYVTDKTIKWLNPNFKFFPDFMSDDIGNFTCRDDIMEFVPHSNRWYLSLTNNRFYLSGTNAKDLFPAIDLQSVNNLEYTVSGTYNKNHISDLQIQIADQIFTGSVTANSVTLKTPLLNLDSFTNQDYIDNYAEMEFLSNAPIMLPFDLGFNISLSADTIIYNGNEYKNFLYSLKSDTQTFSITDQSRGNLLATIRKHANQYDIFMQLNKFVTNGRLLSLNMPLNVYDTIVTAEIDMHTSGYIAHDLEYNLAGKMDLMFNGGYLSGLGIDNFYASAENITILNSEYAISNALEDGETKIKKMRIVGDYAGGDFRTTQPIELQMRHADAIGHIEIQDGLMFAKLNLILRGTSPDPQPITLEIAPNNTRGYSLSEIMKDFDGTYLRDFVRTHNRF